MQIEFTREELMRIANGGVYGAMDTAARRALEAAEKPEAERCCDTCIDADRIVGAEPCKECYEAQDLRNWQPKPKPAEDVERELEHLDGRVAALEAEHTGERLSLHHDLLMQHANRLRAIPDHDDLNTMHAEPAEDRLLRGDSIARLLMFAQKGAVTIAQNAVHPPCTAQDVDDANKYWLAIRELAYRAEQGEQAEKLLQRFQALYASNLWSSKEGTNTRVRLGDDVDAFLSAIRRRLEGE